MLSISFFSILYFPITHWGPSGKFPLGHLSLDGHSLVTTHKKMSEASNQSSFCHHCFCCFFSSVQSLSHVWLFATPQIAARQASLSNTNSQSLLKLMPIESVMPSSHVILCRPFSSCPQSLPASGSFQMSQLFALGGQSIGISASTSVLPMNTQDWSPLGWTGWISLQSKGLSSIFSNTTVQKHQFFGA